jgi:hypothetical protein
VEAAKIRKTRADIKQKAAGGQVLILTRLSKYFAAVAKRGSAPLVVKTQGKRCPDGAKCRAL